MSATDNQLRLADLEARCEAVGLTAGSVANYLVGKRAASAIGKAVGAVGGWSEWKHPRSKNGMFIEVNSPVNVKGSDGKSKRGEVTKLTRKGPEVTYADGTKETIPLADSKKRITAGPKSVARLSDNTSTRVNNAPGTEDAWINGRGRNAPGTPPAPNGPPSGPPAAPPTGTRRERIKAQYGVEFGDASPGNPWPIKDKDGNVVANLTYATTGPQYVITLADGTEVGRFTDRIKALEAAGKANAGTTASAMTAASTAEYKEWEHLRGANGQFITKGGAVNVTGNDGQVKRGTILAFTPEGPVVEYPDGTREVVPVADASARISQAPVARARLTSEDIPASAAKAKINFDTPAEAADWNKYKDGVLSKYDKNDPCTKAAAEVVRSGSYTEDSNSCIGAADSPTAKLLLEMHNKGVAALPNSDLGDEEKSVGVLAARMLNLDVRASQDPKIAAQEKADLKEKVMLARQAASDARAETARRRADQRRAAADAKAAARESARNKTGSWSSKRKAKKPQKVEWKDIKATPATPTKSANAGPTGPQRANVQTSKRAKEQ